MFGNNPQSNGSDPGGNVVGPASSTDNNIAIFDGTTGRLLKNSSTTDVNLSFGTLATGHHYTIKGYLGATLADVQSDGKVSWGTTTKTGKFTFQGDAITTGVMVAFRNSTPTTVATLLDNGSLALANNLACGGGTASGTNCVSLGASTTATSTASFAIGQDCTASGVISYAYGLNSLASRQAMNAFAGSQFSTKGDSQNVAFVLSIKTTNNTPSTMYVNGAQGGTERLTIPSGKMMSGILTVQGIKSDGSAAAMFLRQVAIKNVGGTTSLVGTVNTIGTDIEDAATDIAVTADNTNDSLQVNVTGITGETWRWSGSFQGVETGYGT